MYGHSTPGSESSNSWDQRQSDAQSSRRPPEPHTAPPRRPVPEWQGSLGPMRGLDHRARCGTLSYLYWSAPQGFLTSLLLVFLRSVSCMRLSLNTGWISTLSLSSSVYPILHHIWLCCLQCTQTQSVELLLCGESDLYIKDERKGTPGRVGGLENVNSQRHEQAEPHSPRPAR